jgi:uridine kinase
MQGDKLRIQRWHKSAAAGISEILNAETAARPEKFVISVAGESGAGKSEISFVLAEILEGDGTNCLILQQDDYFVYPPKTNADKRQENINHVGLSEVHLNLLDDHLQEFMSGNDELVKPLVVFEEDQITRETVFLDGIKILIAEGTYTTALRNVHQRVFIDRTYIDTMEARKLRAREKQGSFLDKILKIEHNIISSHKSEADIIVTRDYEAIKVENYE